MTQTSIPIKRSRVRKPTAPRTCCPSHTDTCRFGRQHLWATPFYDRTDGGQVWRTDAAFCSGCESICVAPDWAEDAAQAAYDRAVRDADRQDDGFHTEEP